MSDRRRFASRSRTCEVATMSVPGPAGETAPVDVDGGVWDHLGMSIRIQCICVDTTDPASIATWWSQALGWRITLQSDDEWVLEPPAGSPEDGVSPDLLFLKVPEPRTTKNRLHLDLRPDDQAAELARFEELGARRVDVGQSGDASWVVMADPDGNEFCILRALTPEELAQ